MAWTDACKIAFKMNATALLTLQKGRKNKTAVLKKLGKDTGIPFETLKRWYYEKDTPEKENSVNNDTTLQTNGNDSENHSLGTPDESASLGVGKNPPIPICKKCGGAKVEILSSTGKPASLESKYYGLCSRCRKKAKITSDAINLATEEESGDLVICPNCEHHFYLKRDKKV